MFFSNFSRFDHDRLFWALDHLRPEVVFRETDHDRVLVARILRNNHESVSAHILRRLGQLIRGLRGDVRGRTAGLFGSLSIPPDVETFAAACGVAAGVVRREYRDVGLAPPHDLLTIAALAGTYDDLCDRTETMRGIADSHAFDSARSLQRRMKKLVGLSPRRFVRTCDRAEFARRLAVAGSR